MRNCRLAASVFPKYRNIDRRQPSSFKYNLKAYGVRTIIFWVSAFKNSSCGNRPVAGRCFFLDQAIVFDPQTPSDFKGILADIAVAPPGARIYTS